MTVLNSPLSEDEAVPESFHDCKVVGVHWKSSPPELSLDIQYILEWIPPPAESLYYRFLVARSRLTFHGVEGVRLEFDWTKDLLGPAEIAELKVVDSRRLPNGGTQRWFRISFSDPDAIVSLWSTKYDLTVVEDPILSELPSLPE